MTDYFNCFQMIRQFNYLLFVLIFIIGSSFSEKICVPGEDVCKKMMAHPSLQDNGMECVSARDRVECLQMLKSGEVDVTVTSNSELFLAHLLYPGAFSVIAETRTEKDKLNDHRYEGVAVVRKSTIKNVSSLKGSKSCHTGYYRTAGWHIPIATLRSKGLMKMSCSPNMSVVEQDLDDFKNFFESGCVPGPWAPDDATDKEYLNRFDALCYNCGGHGDERCTSKDPYAGYAGALACLLNGADVAWTKYSEVTKFFLNKSEDVINKYGLLCPDDRIMDVIQSNSDVSNCAWAGRPWMTWLVRVGDSNPVRRDALVDSLSSILVAAVKDKFITDSWTKVALGISDQAVIHKLDPVSPKYHLEQANFLPTLTNISCAKEHTNLCVESDVALEKCQLLSKVMYATRVRPELECVKSDTMDQCISMVGTVGSMVTTADGADVYKAHKLYETHAILTEQYNGSDASYYAVAVVKKSSKIADFKDLKNKKSCHTGIGKTSGWKMPVATLLEKSLLTNGNCDYATEISTFFSASCAPGAKDLDIDSEARKRLCELCIGGGGGDSKCNRNSDEHYYGYSGAFRCLVEKGDVAFVKHTTVSANTDGRNSESWASGLVESDYMLLCPKGGTALVKDYLYCNLERVPAHMMIIGPNSTAVEKEEVKIQFLRASKNISPSTFLMFGKFNGKKDMIFKDSATKLTMVPTDEPHSSIQKSYNYKLDELDSCGSIVSNTGNTVQIWNLIFITFLLICSVY